MVAQTALDERMKAQCSGLLQEIQQASVKDLTIAGVRGGCQQA